jgi:hypothetical protein
VTPGGKRNDVVTADTAFGQWIAELRFEAEQVYSCFEVVREDWRPDYEAGRTPAEAFERIRTLVCEARKRRRLS